MNETREWGSNYTKKVDKLLRVLNYRAEFSNGSGFDVQIVIYHAQRIGVSIDRIGHFIFRGWDPLTNPNSARYVGEKLFMNESDSSELISFFSYIYKNDFKDEE